MASKENSAIPGTDVDDVRVVVDRDSVNSPRPFSASSRFLSAPGGIADKVLCSRVHYGIGATAGYKVVTPCAAGKFVSIAAAKKDVITFVTLSNDWAPIPAKIVSAPPRP